MAGGEAATSLAPGFRFHPTDEELVRYYLKRKVTNKPFRFDPISFLDIYKSEPWDLPGKAKLKSRDLEWYFFSVLDKKYGNGSKTNRATEKGYWKTTGKDRPVWWNSRTVGMKKTLVYHLGRAPRGERTNWVMHEYRLTDEELEKAGVAQNAFVLCRIFQKSGSGPKNGERYGAPFVEEEWDNDDEVAALPFVELLSANEVVVQDDICAETNDLDQNYDVQATFQNAVVPPNFNYGSSSHYVEHSADSIDTDLKPDGLVPQNVPNRSHGQNLLGILDQQAMDSKSVIDACGAQSCNNIYGAGFNHYFDPYLVAADNRQVEDVYEQNNDVFNSGEPDSLVDSAGFDVVEEYLNFFDAEDENLTFDPSELIGNEDTALDEVPVPNKDVNEVNEVASVSSPTQTEMDINNNASSSKKKPEPVEYEPDTKNPYMKQASYLLGDTLTPPAFASEFPVKGAALQLNAGESSTSVHVTAGVIRIESTGLGSNSLDLPFGKGREVDVVFSFGVSISNPARSSLVPTGSLFWGKARLLVPLSWLFLLFWTLVLSVTYKIGVSICYK